VNGRLPAEWLLTAEQKRHYAGFNAFVSQNILPQAGAWDRAERLPDSILSRLGDQGYLAGTVTAEWGGRGWDTVTLGLLLEAVARGSSGVAGVLTVQAMVTATLAKWGSAEQKGRWLVPLAKGEMIGAFALTEPDGGSNIQSLVTDVRGNPSADGTLLLNGTKRWISNAQMASIFVVFAQQEGRSLACLVPRDAPGLRIEPIQDLMGYRGAGLAELHFDHVKVPPSDVVGKPGFAISHIAPYGLHYGRICTACAGLGLLRACFEESAGYASRRKVGGEMVGEMGMIQSMLARMGADLEAGTQLCHSTCRAADDSLPEAFEQALIAKYFTSKAAVRAASDAVQIHGAAGCHGNSAVSRYYRDVKILEIIEGTTQIHERLLGKIFLTRGPARMPDPV
jgi:alkylation response protein AidB-like acyl-CoA dehydrogenase